MVQYYKMERLLYIASGIAIQSWILPLYSIVTYGAALKTIDYIVEGIDRSKAVMIITSHPDKISKAIIEALAFMTISEVADVFKSTETNY